ncbi:TPA: hypothetical protein R7I63_003679, partial [Klebsiella pneumoniae]|nr:hypothetical protein [Klebsiella pneumoniae]
MTRLPESSSWEEEIELISRSERVAGGLDGPANRPLKSLANRTRYLKDRADTAGESIAEKVSAVKTFAEGATLESPREEILFDSYRLVWTGGFPKTVLAGSTPQGTGGIGAGCWAYTSDAVIRQELGSGEGLLYIGSVPTIAHLSTISPAVAGQRIQVTEFAYGYIVGGGNFIVQHAADFIADGGKVVASGIAGLVFVREEYYASRIVRPEWYGCRGRGASIPDTIPFANMLAALNDGDHIKLMANSVHYNHFPNNSQVSDGWVITADNITLDG